MLPHRHTGAQRVQLLKIQISARHTRAFFALADDFAPGVADQTVAIGSAPAAVLPPLSRRHHPNLIFNSAGTYQGVPVCVARLPGKGGGQADPVDPLLSQGSE